MMRFFALSLAGIGLAVGGGVGLSAAHGALFDTARSTPVVVASVEPIPSVSRTTQAASGTDLVPQTVEPVVARALPPAQTTPDVLGGAEVGPRGAEAPVTRAQYNDTGRGDDNNPRTPDNGDDGLTGIIVLEQPVLTPQNPPRSYVANVRTPSPSRTPATSSDRNLGNVWLLGVYR